MSSESFVQIIVSLITIIGAIVSSYVIPYLQTKVSETEMSKLINFAKKTVEWANQTIPQDEYRRKKEEVMSYVADYMDEHLKISLSYEQIDIIVEALVNEAKKVV